MCELNKKNFIIPPPKVDSSNDTKNLATLTCQVDKITEAKRSKIKIKLRFLRQRLFSKSGEDVDVFKGVYASKPFDSDESSRKSSEEDSVPSGQMLDEVIVTAKSWSENYKERKSRLKVGYIYVIRADKPSKYDEYFVDENGKITLLKKKTKRDVRKKTRRGALEYIEVKYGEKYWISYSVVQWSSKFLKTIRGSDIKPSFMKLIECTGEENSYADIYIGFSEGKDSSTVITEQQNLLDHLYNKELAEEPITEGYIRKDMFITLDDPVNMAEKIADRIEVESANHIANVAAIRSGESPCDTLERFKSTGFASKDEDSLSKREKEMSDMFTLALISYQLVYNNPDKTKDFQGGEIGSGFKSTASTGENLLVGVSGIVLPFLAPFATAYFQNTAHYDKNGIYKPKLLNILGVEERRKQRNLIRSLQDDLAKALKTNYLNDQLIVFSHQDVSNLCNLIGKAYTARYLRLLIMNPHKVDKELDLSRDEETDIEWLDFAYEKLCGSGDSRSNTSSTSTCNLIKTLKKSTVINFKVQKDAEKMGLAFADLCTNFYGSVLSFASRSDKIPVTVNLKILNKVLPDGKEVFYAYDFRGAKETTIKVHSLKSRRAKKILVSTGFNRVLGALRVFNALVAVKALTTKGDITKKDLYDISGKTAELLSARLALKEAKLIKATGEGFAKKSAGSIGLKAFGAIGGSVGVYMSYTDARDCYKKHDNDAGAAYTIAAAAGVAGVIAIIWSGATWAGPLGWIAGAVGTIAVIFAAFLADSDLETFFKMYIFNDRVKLKENSQELTWEHNNRFYDKRMFLLENDESLYHYLNFKKTISELFGILVNPKINITSVGKFYEEKTYSYTTTKYVPSSYLAAPDEKKVITHSARKGYISSFKLSLTFNMFLYHESLLSYDIYYTDEKKGDYGEPLNVNSSSSLVLDSDKPPEVILSIEGLQLDMLKPTSNSYLLFISRLKIGENEKGHGRYFPVGYDDKDLYIGALIKLFIDTRYSTTDHDVLFSIDTIENLKNLKLKKA